MVSVDYIPVNVSEFIETRMKGKIYMNKLHIRELNALTLAVFLVYVAPRCVEAEEPWWHDPHPTWTSFTALPEIPSVYGNSWVFAERQQSNDWELAAVYAGQLTNSVMMIAGSTTLPLFRVVATNWSSGSANYNVGLTSLAAVQWTNQSRDFFIGSGRGLFRYNEETELLDTIWPWWWDPIYIADLGVEIAGLVPNFGSQSGLHRFSPVTGHQFVTAQGGMGRLWADPVSHTFDDYYPTLNEVVRLISDSQSIIFRNYDFSTNGGLSYVPIGVRSDGVPIRVFDAYVYAAPDVVILLSYHTSYELLIGKLSGTFYSLGLPGTSVNSFYYSRHSRLLIAGYPGNLYSTVLPEPNRTLPVLTIERGVIVSWDISNAHMTLEGTTNVLGSWTPVMVPYATNGNRVEVGIPTLKDAEFFRLSH